jgi:DNA invertase Pin-like site-specific DNA recombinase
MSLGGPTRAGCRWRRWHLRLIIAIALWIRRFRDSRIASIYAGFCDVYTLQLSAYMGNLRRMEGDMRVAIYCRVSTDRQETENQALQLREFAAKQGWTVSHEYVDYESGGKADRAQFQQMFTDASRRKFDLLLFWALDRLSREGALKTLQHLDRLESYGVAYRSFTEPYFDSCGIFKEAVVSIVATLAKQERIRRSERTKAGLARVRASGRRLGPPRRLNGQHTAQVVSLRSLGLSGREIARRLSISEGSVRRLSAAA